MITSVAPNSHHMAHKAVNSHVDASKWSKMGRGRKLATVRLPPFEVLLILKYVSMHVCVCVFWYLYLCEGQLDVRESEDMV